MKRILALVLVAVLTLGLVACGSTPAGPDQPSTPGTSGDTPKSSAGDGLIKVGIVNNPPSESGYRAANVADFEKVFTEANGYKTSTFYSLKNDEQLNAAAQFITDGVDYLLISAAATDGWTNVLENAQKAGIKVFLFDRMMNVDESLFEAAVVSDMAAQGRMAVQWLLDQKLPEYNVVHIQGAMGSDAQIGRTTPLDEQFQKGTMKRVAQQTATWDEATAKQIVESVINSNESFNVIYAENDGMAKGAVAALDEAGITHGVNGDVVVIGFDCNKWALREVLAGNWNLDVQCSPFQAEKINEMIQDLEAGKTIPEKIVINEETYFDAATITQEDIDKYGLGD
ncbi:MAG TPA: substrate-binding domain-containing protein [Clostridiaceae bacterium]|jgi:simple sugar transport system substrate-binding protein|nr:substrate-binding domain-containing protein [Clostridiaceae bacterium]